MQDSRALLPSSFVDGTAARGFDPSRLLAVDDALTVFFGAVALAPPAVETVSLGDALGRVLAAPATARDDIPFDARSTMDGYALAAEAGVAARRVAGDVAMGHVAPRAIGPYDAMRVPTGGSLPEGADTVVPQEDCTLADGTIVPHEAPLAGDCIAARGSDIRAGETVLAAGRRIGAPELGVLATLGIVAVPVFRRPRIAIVSTGDELVDPGEALGPGTVRDSNRYAIAGTLAALGAEAVHVPRAPDTFEAVRTIFARAVATCDAVVSSGGSSVGERDLVPRVIADLGAPGPIVHGLRVKPGKPTLLAAIGAIPIVGLPGNPTSSLMILEAVVAPIVRALTGESARDPVRVRAAAAVAFVGRPGWTWLVPARLHCEGGIVSAEPLRIRSSQTSLLARASGYVTLDENDSERGPGDLVDVTLFSCGGAPLAFR